MDEERVVELKLGCHPEAAVSGGMLLQSESSAYLFFNAMSDEKYAKGYYNSVGTAVIEFCCCHLTKFGGPNDEALPEHPLYQSGLMDMGYSVCEVLHSTWAADVMARARTTAERIWADRFEQAYKDHNWSTRHFIVSFHDSTFECLADDLTLTLHTEPYLQVVSAIAEKIMLE